ncbi:tRNA-specific adenosine deaminase [secondary endosymbiont of Trabutina mannipara]|uniref:tRNA-specific adenosine deaminase n=1 Tax=secondary endosymbiont of Trabutina mannipara TaxID=1835721 RepID=A0A1C3L3T6_9ENTR|nr:tRNA adenosine(34) deaminase TadA [secondary endosymbiont of Trabutina mannipara]SBT81915.1 tRNA-specific adenosine deaminase [secondary endosymbiont of Trabutina mannipara]
MDIYMNYSDKLWMNHALMLTERAEVEEEIPVGAVLILNGNIIGEGWNSSIGHNDPTAHAEIIALRQGGQRIKNYRLLESIMYVTLEPCIMCAGAMIHARISRLVFGAKAKKNGAAGSFLNILKNKNINHKIIINSGIQAQQCSLQLSKFFQQCRYRKKIRF